MAPPRKARILADAPPVLERAERNRIRRRLLRWYDAEKRELPWRGKKDPYHIWVSETMLQQTRAEAVGPRYEKFLSRFPTLASLAAAPLEAVLAEWQGMGYYARARNLHRAARALAESGRGELPRTREELRRLPGVGPYMAGAIASIAFGQRAAAVDGNVLRVLSRLLDHPAPVDRPPGRAALKGEAEALVPSSRPGDFNQALMDLGACLCLPRNPDCARCPLAENCAARRAGTVARRPVRGRKGAPKKISLLQLWAEREGAVLLVRRPEDGLFGGLWELPGISDEGEGRARAAALRRACARLLGPGWRAGPEIARVRRRLTHREMLFTVFRAFPPGEALPRPPEEREGARWVKTPDLAALPLSSAQRAAIRAAGEALADRQGRFFPAGRGSGRALPRLDGGKGGC